MFIIFKSHADSTQHWSHHFTGEHVARAESPVLGEKEAQLGIQILLGIY